MNLERMNILIEVLEKVRDEKRPFSMRNWISDPIEGCGTAACAAGYAALDPRLQEQGLSLSWKNNVISSLPDDVVSPTSMGFAHIHYKYHRDFEALREFFDLNFLDANHIFGSSDISISEVLARIQEIMTDTPPGAGGAAP